MQLITLEGTASGKVWELEVHRQRDLELTLLDFLRAHKIPVASSCDGEKICKLCRVNEDILACSVLVKDIINTYNSRITISYL